MSLRRLPPGGSRIPLASLLATPPGGDAAAALRAALGDCLGASPLTLHASGREAMRVAFVELAKRSGRDEIAIPGYACFSIPAAAVAAGLRVRLVDVDSSGRLSPDALANTPVERVAAVVVGNLFGIAEPLAPLRAILNSTGTALLDDAAQSLGARDAEGPAGARGDVGILSFGRGKPLSALGGGAAVWTTLEPPAPPPVPAPRRFAALARAAGYDVALSPWVFRWLAAVPALGIGETVYDPDFPRGGLDGAALWLAASRAVSLGSDNRAHARCAHDLARRIAGASTFRPLVADAEPAGVYPRLAVVAPSAGARTAALSRLAALGASGMYPSALDGIEPLRPALAGDAEVPGARDFAARVLTLPTHGRLRGVGLERVLQTLAELSG